MDQARWLVVVSVVVCMVVVLSALNRNFGQVVPVVEVMNKIARSDNRSETSSLTKVDMRSGDSKKRGWRSLVAVSLKHRKQPEHTLIMEPSHVAQEAQLKIETEGRVIR